MKTIYLVSYKEASGNINTIQYDDVKDVAFFIEKCASPDDKIIITTIQI